MTDILLYADRFTTLSAQIAELRERHPDKISFHSVVLENEPLDLLKEPILVIKREGQEIFRTFVADEVIAFDAIKKLV